MSNASTEASLASDEVDLPSNLLRRALRQHWVTIVVTGMILAIAGVGYASVKPPAYTSGAEILLQPLEANPFSPDSLSTPQQITVGLETEANLIASPDVTARASKILHKEIPAGTKSVTASVISSSQILKIEYTDSTRTGARAGAAAFADAYLQSREDKAKSLRDSTASAIEQQIAAVQKKLDVATKAVRGPKPPADAAAQLQSLSSRLATLEENLSTAKSTSTYSGSLVSPATRPSSLQRVIPFGIAIAAILFGFGLGLVLAILRSWADDRIDSRHQLYAAGLPIWAPVEAIDAPGLTGESADRSAGEPYRQLRAAVIANVPRPCVIAVSSVGSDEATAEISANLAVSLGEAGYRCGIVDAEIDAPGISTIFGKHGGYGLADVLSGKRTLDASTFESHGVTVLSAGDDPMESIELYSSEAFRSILAALRHRLDYLVVAVPEFSSAIGMATAAVADTAVLIVRDGVTTQEEVREARERSRSQRVQIDGLVAVLRARVSK